MRKGKTSIDVTFCISVNHMAGFMDENAIKAIFEAGQRAMANETLCLCSVVTSVDKQQEEVSPDSVAVKVTKVQINGSIIPLNKLGTKDVPLETWTQTEYMP